MPVITVNSLSASTGEVVVFVSGFPVRRDQVDIVAKQLGEAVKATLGCCYPVTSVNVLITVFDPFQPLPLCDDDPRKALLSMKVEDYFGIERFQKAGIVPERIRARVIARCQNGIRESNIFDDGDYNHRIPIVTVGQLLTIGRGRLFRSLNFGKKSCDAVAAIFKMDDLGIF